MSNTDTTLVESKNTFMSDFKQLTKFGLSLSVVFSAVAGYLLAATTIDYTTIALLSIGGYLMVGASNAFNQIIEKDVDKLMKRTRNRPLPTGRYNLKTAMFIAVSFTILGLGILYTINEKTALFGAISIFLYTCAYTPLKGITPLAVFVGAFPGAIPFMLGWVAATNQFGIEAGILFMIQFFWQFPHFWAIGWLGHDEYLKAGYNLLPMGKRDRKAVVQILIYTIMLIFASIIPVFQKTGSFYIYPVTAVIIFLSGCVILYYGILLYKDLTKETAKKLMLASVFYITAIQIIYIIDKFLH
ncbi:protoheme IX farnesyltransferase [Wenyingzhuangia heitensis]|uniref:Protoheme IX farnesyltransferase n=1 Tax=Wenyingzhuangia heitensis TaxID=1487859 RepID=A0ABX0UAI2_9FLAO|nr:heme o synthase [Wenyingzhuangia heitensis]NIJ45837.1 protoheme IX farnesyltransferase [Wenyingzhuangia heitensis]